MEQYFEYGSREIEHLKQVDPKLGVVIDRIGMIQRAVMPDLFEALVHSIVSQQISNKARDTVWGRIVDRLGVITPESIDALSLEELQQFGISFRKAGYIQSAARKVLSGELNIEALESMPDDEVIASLIRLDGVGPWTAEMLMLFSMQRPNVLSYGDLAIKRGIQMVYDLPKVDKKTVDELRNRYSPYASVASLYLWVVAGGD